MPKIRILRNTRCGGQSVAEGEIVNASEADAKTLIGIGKAALHKPAAGDGEGGGKGKKKDGEGDG